MGRKKIWNGSASRSGGRELQKEQRYNESIMGDAARTLAIRNPKAMLKVLRAAANTPVLSVICAKSGVSRHKLGYWLKLSKKGHPGDGFDVPVDDGRTERFHIRFAEAWDEGTDNYELKMHNLATGIERKILTNQQGIIFYTDPDLIALGFTGEEAYLRDENGEPVPQTVPLLDPEMVRWVLSRKRPDSYGNRMQVQHEHKVGGVLVVGATKSSAELEAAYQMKHHEIEDVEFDEVEEPETPTDDR